MEGIFVIDNLVLLYLALYYSLLVIGEPFWCVIHKCECTSIVTTLRVSSKVEHVNESNVVEVNNLEDLFPGMRVELIVDKVYYKICIQYFYFTVFVGYFQRNASQIPQ